MATTVRYLYSLSCFVFFHAMPFSLPLRSSLFSRSRRRFRNPPLVQVGKYSALVACTARHVSRSRAGSFRWNVVECACFRRIWYSRDCNRPFRCFICAQFLSNNKIFIESRQCPRIVKKLAKHKDKHSSWESSPLWPFLKLACISSRSTEESSREDAWSVSLHIH